MIADCSHLLDDVSQAFGLIKVFVSYCFVFSYFKQLYLLNSVDIKLGFL